MEDSFVIDGNVLCLSDRVDRTLQELAVIVLPLELEAEQETTPRALVRWRLTEIAILPELVATEEVDKSQYRTAEKQYSRDQ